MRLHFTLMLTTLLLCASGICADRLKNDDANAVIARLSYSNSYSDGYTDEGHPRICFALYGGGYYQVSRVTKGATETLQGTLSSEQASELLKIISKFDSQFGGGNVVREGAETLVVDAINAGQTVRHAWNNADHEHPFPTPALKIIEWLQKFDTAGSSPLTLRELSAQPICPPGSVRPLRPVVATSDPATAASCGARGR